MRTLIALRLWTLRGLVRRGLRELKNPLTALLALGGLGLVGFAVTMLLVGQRELKPGWWSRPAIVGGVTMGLFQLTLGAWLFPARMGLAFAAGEVCFLFPAPLTRAQLIRARILTAQPGLLAGAAFASLVLPLPYHAGRLLAILGLHLAFTFVYLNRLAVSLAVVPDPGTGRAGPVRPIVAALLALAFVTVVWSFPSAELWVGLTVEDVVFSHEATLRTLSERVGTWASAGLPWLLLAPFRAFGELADPDTWRPTFQLLRALLLALGVTALPYLYAVHGRAPFMEVALQASEVWQLRLEQMRATGRWIDPARGALPPPPLPLELLPGPEWALGWKGLAGVTRIGARRYAVTSALLLLIALIAVRSPDVRPWCVFAGMACSSALGVALLTVSELGFPDLRVLLQRPAFLKTLPLQGWRIFLGAVISTSLATWLITSLLALLAAILSETPVQNVPLDLRLGLAGAAVIGLLPTTAFLVVFTNAAAAAFPRLAGAWPPRGVLDVLALYAVIFARSGALVLVSIPALLVASVVAGISLVTVGPAGLPAAGLAYGAIVAAATAPLVLLGGILVDRFEPLE